MNILQILWRAGMVNTTADTMAHRDMTDLLLQPPLEIIDMLNWKGFDRAIEAGYTLRAWSASRSCAAVALQRVPSSNEGWGRVPEKKRAGPVTGAGPASPRVLLLFAEVHVHPPVPEHARDVVGRSIEAIQLAAVAVRRIFIEQVVDADRERPARRARRRPAWPAGRYTSSHPSC